MLSLKGKLCLHFDVVKVGGASTYLVRDLLIERLKCVSEAPRLQILIDKHLLELADHPVEHSSCDLVGIDLRRERVLDVRVAHLERLVHHVMFVRLHLPCLFVCCLSCCGLLACVLTRD